MRNGREPGRRICAVGNQHEGLLGVSVEINNTGPASGSHAAAVAADVGRIRAAVGGRDAESLDGWLSSPAHTRRKVSAGRTRWERRNSFIRRNLDPLPSPSTVIMARPTYVMRRIPPRRTVG